MPTAVSAPGKVLLAGGYLVLDRAYTGLVFGLSARIHVLVHDIPSSSGVEISEIVVQSPQFQSASWIYGFHLTADQGGVAVTQLNANSTAPTSRNPFVETALQYALTYISTVLPTTKIKPTKLTILADDSYYSNPAVSTITPTSRFSNFNVPLTTAHKTGLGSSAALVTALTGALLTHYLPKQAFDPTTPSSLSILHNLSQTSHCTAQGKIGSGFDIAAAVYGTCIYRRFTPSILTTLPLPTTPNFAPHLKSLIETPSKWDTEIHPNAITLPPNHTLLMCDVDHGSQTVHMVKSIQTWREKNPTLSKSLYNNLQSTNESLAKALSSNNPIQITTTLQKIRSIIREISTLSKVPIEPEEQTHLINAITDAVPGVLGGVVPGAGGYDAIVLLVRDDEVTIKQIREFLKGWDAGRVRLLDARGELEGVRVENVEGYGLS